MPHLNIQRLELRDFRCFEAIDICFHERLTVLVGANGAGKSAILDAVAVAFGPFVGAFDEARGKHFRGEDIRQYQARHTGSNEMEYASDGVRLRATGCIPGAVLNVLGDGDELSTWRRALSSPSRGRTTIKDAKQLALYGEQLQKEVRTPGNDAVLPLIAHYGTGRLWQQKNLTQRKSSAKEKGSLSRTSRTIGYTDCLESGSNYKQFVDWFRYWNFNAKNAMVKALEAKVPLRETEFSRYVESVHDAVNDCLRYTDWCDIDYSFASEQLVAQHNLYGRLSVDMLSDGIRSMIAMVGDIAFRATKLNGHLGERASRETPGVVLIDEVDMHLHPAWQQVVLHNLTWAFPKLQFIVTTHSPQVLSAVGKESIRLLHRDAETGEWQARTPSQEIKGVESAAALREIMGVNPVPPVAEAAWINEYTAMIEAGTHEAREGKALREKLEKTYGVTHPVLRDADKLIRFQAFKQRAEKRKKE